MKIKYWLIRWWRIWRNKPAFTTATGRVVTDREVYALADEAERGYDVSQFVRRDGPDG